MNKEPLVSIISGYYNRENLVDESIQSLVDQTCQNLEIIIFDDCSTDNTYEKLRRFEADKRVRIIRHEKNMGFVRGLTNAISQSKGEFIAIHGSGDYSYPTRIEKQLRVLLDNEKISVVGCENEIYKNGEIVGTTNRYPAGDFYEDFIKANRFSGGDVMFNRSYYENVGGYREFFKYAQDYDLWCRMSLISEYHIIPEILYRRRRDVDSSVSDTPQKRIRRMFYGAMAHQSVKMRKTEGYDCIDMLGAESFAMLERTKRISRRLSVYAIKLYLEGEHKLEFEMAVKILKVQKKTVHSLFVILLYHKIIPYKLVKKLWRIKKEKKHFN